MALNGYHAIGQVSIDFVRVYLEVRSVVACDEGTVALGEDHNFLLDVFDLIFGFLQVNDFDGDDLLRPVVDAFEHLAERALADPLLLCKYQLRIHLLLKEANTAILIRRNQFNQPFSLDFLN